EIHPITYYNNFTSVTAYYCWDDDDFNGLWVAVYQLMIMFVIPGVLMLFCYFCVIQELWSSTKVITNMTANGQRNSSNTLFTLLRNIVINRYFLQVIKMLLFVIIVFLVCWGPRLIMNVVIKFGLSSFDNYTYTTRVTCNLLSFVHCALNPFVYGFMSSSFRQMMINSCSPGRSANNVQMNLDPLANHHIIGCVNIKHLLSKNSKHRRSSDAYDPSCTGTSNVTIPLSINVNGLNTPLNTSPSSSRTRVIY
ncbi:G protein-coupled receptor-like protein 3, partial [Leptotrombidium deliense]